MDNLNTGAEEPVEEIQSEQEQGQNTFLRLLTPVKDYFATPVIILANVLLFFLMVINGSDFLAPEAKDMIDWGANFRPLTINGGLWRLFTSCFLHIGVIHLVLNMYALITIGPILEPLVGSVRFLLFYLLTGIAGSATSFFWYESTVSAGASGAIFGMYGLFLFLLQAKLVEDANRKNLLVSVLIFIAYNLFFGLKGGVDNAAHLGGLASGLVLGGIYYFMVKSNAGEKLALIFQSIAVVLVMAYVALVYSLLPADLSKYYSEMERITKLETEALYVYSLPQNTNRDVYIAEVKKALGIWDQVEKIVADAYSLDVPEKYKRKNDLLKEYFELRKKSFEVILKALEENSAAYNQEVEILNAKVLEATKKLEEYK